MKRLARVRSLGLAAAACTLAAAVGTGAGEAGRPDVRVSPAGTPWQPDIAAGRAYARRRAGRVSFAVRTPARLYGHHANRTARSASVVKAMLMVAYLDHRHVRARPLSGVERALLAKMVRRSSNAAASRIHDYVGDAALRRLARRAGMRRFRTAGSWSRSRISAGDQARLFLRIDGLVVARHRSTAMRLLRTIVAAQRWGVARARPPGWAIYFKGGWDDDPGGVDHQAALLRRGERRVAVAVLTTGNPSHRYGKDTLRGIARRLLRGLGHQSLPR